MIWIDHVGREVAIGEGPQRIISLCPSQTSTLIAMGLENKLVGRTLFCIHPQDIVKNVAIVGGTKTLKHEKIESLKPDLVICEKEENTQEMVAWLSDRYPVYVTDVHDLVSAEKMVLDLGRIAGATAEAEYCMNDIQVAMRSLMPMEGSPSVLYFIWRNPWMLAGKDTYIQSVLHRLGFLNLALPWTGRYPELPSVHVGINPDFIFLSSEPFPFKEKHMAEVKRMFPRAKVVMVDGEMFSWYGERQRALPDYWHKLRYELKGEIPQ